MVKTNFFSHEKTNIYIYPIQKMLQYTKNEAFLRYLHRDFLSQNFTYPHFFVLKNS